MRFRVFSISLFVGLISAVLVTVLHVSYAQSERLSLIDDQLREIALAVIKSELVDLRRGEYAQADEILQDELGPQRIGKIFVIRNEKNEILFQSQGAMLLEKSIPREPQWVTLVDEDRWIRVLNLKLPKVNDRTLQVGAVYDAELFGAFTWSWRVALYTLAVFVVITAAAFALSSFVMRPFRRLHANLEDVGTDLSTYRPVRGIPLDGFKFALRRKNDEFGLVLKMLNDLIERFNAVTHATKLWSVRLAHELKTPLTILRLEIEEDVPSGPKREKLLDEVGRVASMVGHFLSWAEAGMEPATKLSPHSAFTIAADVVDRLSRLAPGRISLTSEGDWSPSVLPEHLHLIIGNLIENALKYSPPDEPVKVVLKIGEIQVIDHGPGFPESVTKNIGVPFNRGTTEKTKFASSGLGLALVSSLCRRYGWRLVVERKGEETHVRVISDYFR